MEKLTRVNFTNLDKILYPDNNVTKKDVIEYYIREKHHTCSHSSGTEPQ